MRKSLIFLIILSIVVSGFLTLTIGQRLEIRKLRMSLSERPTVHKELQAETVSSHTGGLETEVQQPEPVATGRYLFPLAESDYRFTSPHGVRISPLTHTKKYHTGLDISSVWRAQVVAIADGVVVEHWPPPDGYYRGHPVYGGMLTIDHGEGVLSLYAHLSQTYVHEGYSIKAGEVIGRIGSTGKADGEHLHFSMQIDGEIVNPLLYLNVLEGGSK